MNIIDILYKLSPFFISIILFIKSNKKLITSLKIIILLKIIIHLINDYTNYNIVNYIEYLLFTLTAIPGSSDTDLKFTLTAVPGSSDADLKFQLIKVPGATNSSATTNRGKKIRGFNL